MGDLPLNDDARRRIEATKAEAVARLLRQLSNYLKSAAVSRVSLEERDPSEVIALFERYAQTQYDSKAQELLAHFSDVEKYGLYLATTVIDSIVLEILPASYFQPENPEANRWTDLAKLLRDIPSESRDQAFLHLDGEWEILLEHSFKRHLFKTDRIRALGKGIQDGTEVESFRGLFYMKYLLHLRLFASWYSFDTRIRLHVSNRTLYWMTQFQRRAIAGLGEARKKSPEQQPNEVERNVLHQADNGRRRVGGFHERAAWLDKCLYDRTWNKHDLAKWGGPDHKTTQKVLDGKKVRPDVLEKIVYALSEKRAKVKIEEVPQN